MMAWSAMMVTLAQQVMSVPVECAWAHLSIAQTQLTFHALILFAVRMDVISRSSRAFVFAKGNVLPMEKSILTIHVSAVIQTNRRLLGVLYQTVLHVALVHVRGLANKASAVRLVVFSVWRIMRVMRSERSIPNIPVMNAC